MNEFSYELNCGTKKFTTDKSQLLVVTRRAHPDREYSFALNTFCVPIVQNIPSAWISVLFDPLQLGRLKLWRDIHKVNPLTLAKNIHHNLGEGLNCSTHKETTMLLGRFGLVAAAGLCIPQEAIDVVVSAIPVYNESVAQTPHLHDSARGVLNAHLQRAT